MEIELNFRLDAEGRTANTSEPDGEKENNVRLDYSFQSTTTNLSNLNLTDQEFHDDLLFDCEISDSGLMPRTFWVPCDMKPRCTLEKFALDVFNKHVPKNMDFDRRTSGAEWWCQIRPSPEGTGRYSMHDDDPDEISKTGISFHWDKDEDLRLLTGGNTFIHPHLSTITYLTDFGSPTLITNCRVHNLTGEWMVPSNVEGFVSWPKMGKHTCFDGRYLHAALPALMAPGAFEKQIQFQESNDKQKQKLLKRRHRRVTFLVNIWLNYKPFNVEKFPDLMVDKLSGHKDEDQKGLVFTSSDGIETKVFHTDSKVTKKLDGKFSNKTPPKKFTWPMGGCDSRECIKVYMPLEEIRSEATTGGNVMIHWESKTIKKDDLEDCFELCKDSEDGEKNAKRPRTM